MTRVSGFRWPAAAALMTLSVAAGVQDDYRRVRFSARIPKPVDVLR